MKDKKSRTIFILVGILLLVITVIFFGEKLNNSNNKEEKKEVVDIKVDNDKDYFYEAEYDYNNEYKEYVIGSEEKTAKYNDGYFDITWNLGTQRLNDLKVPYINLKMAAGITDELKLLYERHANKFDSCASEGGCYQVLQYHTFRYKNILSTVTIEGVSKDGEFTFNYYTYSFNLETGDYVNFNKMLPKIGYDKEKVISDLEGQIKDYLDSQYGSTVDLNNCTSLDGKTDSCYNISNENLRQSMRLDEIKYFIDEDGTLNVLANPYCNHVENGDIFLHAFKVEK